MEKLKEQYSIDIQWRSYELRPPDAPPISAEYRERIEANAPQFEKMADARYGIKINRGPFGVDSRPALIGAKFAEAQGVGDAYHQAVFEAYWLHGRDISDLAVLADSAEGVGLDRADFLVALDDPQWLEEVLADVAQAQAYGLGAVPSAVFNNRYLVRGAQPYEAFEQVADKVLAEISAE